MSSSDEESLTVDCPVCMQTLLDPRTLHCGHSLCQACLRQLIVTAAPYQENEPIGTVACPVCRSECHNGTSEDWRRLQGLRKTVGLADFVSNEVKRRRRHTALQKIREKEEEKIHSCQDCVKLVAATKLYMCNECGQEPSTAQCIGCFGLTYTSHTDHDYQTLAEYNAKLGLWRAIKVEKLSDSIVEAREMLQTANKAAAEGQTFDNRYIGGDLLTRVTQNGRQMGYWSRLLERTINEGQDMLDDRSLPQTDNSMRRARMAVTKCAVRIDCRTTFLQTELRKFRSLAHFAGEQARYMARYVTDFDMNKIWTPPSPKRARAVQSEADNGEEADTEDETTREVEI